MAKTLPKRTLVFNYFFKGLSLIILLILYYVLYMKTALKQYNLKSTTMSERMEEVKGTDN